MTLIELLITVAIIATLSVMFLGASRAAMENSRASRTRTTIAKLHTLLMEQYASYETRRVEVRENWLKDINDIKNTQVRAAALADLRLIALRETMKYEMPDCWSDVLDAPQTISYPPTIVGAYQRRYRQSFENNNDDETIRDNENAECLYLVIMLMTGDGEARSQFAAQDIGDVDGDGNPEFLDGWGNPIRWIRWPAGFVGKSFLMSGDPDDDHDPFDPFRRNSRTVVGPADNVYPSAAVPYVRRLRQSNGTGLDIGNKDHVIGFRIVPLILSSGPDEISDIDMVSEFTMSDPDGYALDPYEFVSSERRYEFGSLVDFDQDGDDDSVDNIHNHLQDMR